jgi:hypothetical protein
MVNTLLLFFCSVCDGDSKTRVGGIISELDRHILKHLLAIDSHLLQASFVKVSRADSFLVCLIFDKVRVHLNEIIESQVIWKLCPWMIVKTTIDTGRSRRRISAKLSQYHLSISAND